MEETFKSDSNTKKCNALRDLAREIKEGEITISQVNKRATDIFLTLTYKEKAAFKSFLKERISTRIYTVIESHITKEYDKWIEKKKKSQERPLETKQENKGYL